MLDQCPKLRTRQHIAFELVDLLDHCGLAFQSCNEGEDELIKFAAERMIRIGADLVQKRRAGCGDLF